MPDAQDLNQIEYRHHPTRDLSPAASSMSPQSRSAWHAQIRAWVRHPHDERLSESACYQVFPNGSAALAWRYWDERAAERADGSRGRPLVSRVLAGPASVLSPKVAVALSRNGPTADLIGMLPGEVPDGMEMPTVSGSAVAALADEMAPELDEAAMRENALQAIVAAALNNPSTPLAVSLRESVIAKPLGQCVQCTLLWGLLRVTGPLLGGVGRGWSFSTFELPLGDTDTAALPGIVFRQAQDTRGVPGVNWRKEIKVRPLAPDALSDAVPYADQVELAGWLVAEYRDRGGDGLALLLADACGNERSLQGRLERLQHKLGAEHSVVISSQGSPYVTLHAERSAQAALSSELSPPAPRPALDRLPAPGSHESSPVPEETATANAVKVVDEPGEPAGTAPETSPPEEVPSGLASVARETEGVLDEVRPDQTVIAQQSETDWARRLLAESGPVSRRIAGLDPGDWDNEVSGAGARGDWFRSWTIEEVAPRRDRSDAPNLPLSDRADNPDQEPHIDQSPSADRQPNEQAGQSYPQGQPPYSEGQPYAQPSQEPYQQEAAGQHVQRPYSQAQQSVTVSFLLKQLELVGSDPARFRSYLEAIFRLRDVDDPDDRLKSWELISGKYWFRNVSKCEVLEQHELAGIFSIVLIPELRRGGVREEAIANWALDVPAEMIAGLLAAVKEAEDQRPMVHAILESVLAIRWIRDKSMEDLWDKKWPEAAAGAHRQDDKSRLRDLIRLARKRR
jgi:hypothetical protein